MKIDSSEISRAIGKVIMNIYDGDDYLNSKNCPPCELAQAIVDEIAGVFDGYAFADEGYEEELAIKIIRMLNEKYF